MKRLFGWLLAASLCSFSLQASAAEFKIGVLDLHKVIQESSEVKSLNQQLEKTFKPKQEAILKLQRDLESEMAKFTRNAKVLSAAEKTQLEEKIRNGRVSLARKEQDYQRELMSEQNKSMEKFFSKLRKVVNTFAERGKYDLILQKDAAPFSSSSVEVTDQIIKDLS